MKGGKDSKKGSKTSKNDKEKADEPNFEPSDFSKLLDSLPIVDYKVMVPSVSGDIEAEDLSSLGQLNGEDALDVFKELVSIVDGFSDEEFLAPPSEAVSEILNFFRQKLPYRTLVSIASTWPTVVPRSVPACSAFVSLIVKAASRSSNPERFVRWFSMNFPDKKWVKRSTSSNPDVLAMSMANVDNHGVKPAWCVLETNDMFRVFKIKGDQVEQEFEAKAENVRLSDDKKVVIIGESGEEVCKFAPVDSKLAQAWSVSYEKKKASFQNFLSSYEKAIPPIVISAYISCITSLDGYLIRGLAADGVSSDKKLLASSLLNIFTYLQRNNILLGIVIGSVFEKPDLRPNSIKIPSFLTSLFEAYVEKYAGDYVNVFLKKIVTYISHDPDIGFSDIENVSASDAKAVFFSVIKYIIDSAPLVPNELRHFLSVVRQYSIVRFNNSKATYTLLAELFGVSFICSVLRKTKNYFPGMKLDCPNNLSGIRRLLKVAFRLGSFSGEYEVFSSWNERLERHTYPRLYDFILSVADIRDVPEYQAPTQKEFSDSLRTVMKLTADQHKKVLTDLEAVRRSEIAIPGLLGMGVGLVIANHYTHSYDGPNVATTVPELRMSNEINEDEDTNKGAHSEGSGEAKDDEAGGAKMEERENEEEEGGDVLRHADSHDRDDEMREASGEVRDVDGVARDVGGEIRDFDGEIRDASGEMGGFGNEMRNVNGEVRDFGDEMRNVNGEARDFGDEMRNINGEMRGFGDEMRNVNGEVRDFGDEMRDASGEIGDSGNEMRNVNGEMRGFGDEMRNINGEMRGFGGEMKEVVGQMKESDREEEDRYSDDIEERDDAS